MVIRWLIDGLLLIKCRIRLFFKELEGRNLAGSFLFLRSLRRFLDFWGRKREGSLFSWRSDLLFIYFIKIDIFVHNRQEWKVQNREESMSKALIHLIFKKQNINFEWWSYIWPQKDGWYHRWSRLIWYVWWYVRYGKEGRKNQSW